MPIWTIDTYRPLLYVRREGRVSNAEMRAKFDADAENMRAQVASGERVAVISDMTGAEPLDPVQREIQATWFREHSEDLARTTVAVAFVTPNMLLRGVLTAVGWVQRLPFRHRAFKSLDRALPWAIAELSSAGLEVPEDLRTRGHAVFTDEAAERRRYG